jgi:pilus assembly protein CpaF
LQELFKFEVERLTEERVVIGRLTPTGMRPTFLHKFERRGLPLPTSLFQEQLRQVAPAGVLT